MNAVATGFAQLLTGEAVIPSHRVLAPSLADMEAQARERLRAHIDRAADWTLMAYRVQTRDIRDRMDAALIRHRRAVQTAMAHMWLQTEVRNVLRHPATLGSTSGAVSSELFGHKFSGVIFDEIGPGKDFRAQHLNYWSADDADRRARPRGARP